MVPSIIPFLGSEGLFDHDDEILHQAIRVDVLDLTP